MSVVIGAWFALAGGIALLAGLTGRHRVRRLRRSGEPVWAMIVSAPAGPDERPGRPARRSLIQFTAADGRVIERGCPAGGGGRLRPGQRVLVWPDPADPQDFLVYGREGGRANLAFMAAGAVLVLIGTALAALGP
jgi:hypothetical protein